MSEEKKKVIYVKDLVIKAENVRIERERPHHPFFGAREQEQREEEKEEVRVEEEQEHKENDHDRPPFSWI